ncbi:MAG: hypothetical protein GY929_06230 [Actinomycetia bacterium]|nr:hypothetical protein [Actinomycetes bacterium]
MGEQARPELVYLSWGGSGRGMAFRDAYDRAVSEERGIVYLAILDAPTFSDLDGPLLGFVIQELTWLLEAQLRLVDREEMATRVPTRTLVRGGDVADEVSQLVEALDTDLVLVGAPIPFPDHHSVDELVAELARRTGAAVEVIGSAAPA